MVSVTNASLARYSFRTQTVVNRLFDQMTARWAEIKCYAAQAHCEAKLKIYKVEQADLEQLIKENDKSRNDLCEANKNLSDELSSDQADIAAMQELEALVMSTTIIPHVKLALYRKLAGKLKKRLIFSTWRGSLQKRSKNYDPEKLRK